MSRGSRAIYYLGGMKIEKPLSHKRKERNKTTGEHPRATYKKMAEGDIDKGKVIRGKKTNKEKRPRSSIKTKAIATTNLLQQSPLSPPSPDTRQTKTTNSHKTKVYVKSSQSWLVLSKRGLEGVKEDW